MLCGASGFSWSVFLFALSIRCVAFCIDSDSTHGDLFSFPTRRSSDLVMPLDPVAARIAAEQLGLRRSRDQPPRSEEHTSELQSLRHLVCRLLLEKKTG